MRDMGHLKNKSLYFICFFWFSILFIHIKVARMSMGTSCWFFLSSVFFELWCSPNEHAICVWGEVFLIVKLFISNQIFVYIIILIHFTVTKMPKGTSYSFFIALFSGSTGLALITCHMQAQRVLNFHTFI